MTHPDYNAIDAIRFSRLKLMDISPHHYRHHSPKETEAMRIGRATHLAALEPERYHREVAIWKGGRRAGKKWEEFQAEWTGTTILREQDHEKAMLLSKAVRNDTHAARLLSGGSSEVVRVWVDPLTRLKCKARIDYLREVEGVAIVTDLKSTANVHPRDFARTAARLFYHGQLAFYCSSFPLFEPYVIAATSEPPIDVVVYRLPDEAMKAGRRLCDKWLRRVEECTALDNWPGIGGGQICDLKLPEYALADDTPRTLRVGGEEIEV